MAQPGQNQEERKVAGRVHSTCLASYLAAAREEGCVLNGEMESRLHDGPDGGQDSALVWWNQAQSGLC